MVIVPVVTDGIRRKTGKSPQAELFARLLKDVADTATVRPLLNFLSISARG